MPLYGNELDRDDRPAEAGLGRVVKLDKAGDFVGRDALARGAARGPRKQLVGLELRDRGIARHGYPVYAPAATNADRRRHQRHAVPTLGKAIAMAYVPPAAARAGYHGPGRHPRHRGCRRRSCRSRSTPPG